MFFGCLESIMRRRAQSDRLNIFSKVTLLFGHLLTVGGTKCVFINRVLLVLRTFWQVIISITHFLTANIHSLLFSFSLQFKGDQMLSHVPPLKGS